MLGSNEQQLIDAVCRWIYTDRRDDDDDVPFQGHTSDVKCDVADVREKGAVEKHCAINSRMLLL